MRVLLMDGNSRTQEQEALPRELSSRRVNVESASTIGEGLALAAEKRFSAILIERRERPADLIKRIRADSGTPIVVLREAKDSTDAIECLENGADDVLTEPLDIDELVARLRSLTRRCQPGDRVLLKIDDLELSPKELTVRRNGQSILLTNREFELLEYLMHHHDRVLSRTELADQVWGAEVESNSNVIDVSIGRLRGKVHLPGRKPLIHTVTGRGYMISDMPPLTTDRVIEG